MVESSSAPAGEQSLKRRTLGNTALSAGSRAATMALQLGANVVLARHLSSEDYGVVGFAQIFIAMFALLSEFGLTTVAVQARKLPASMLDTGFTLRLLLGVAAFAVVVLVGPMCATILGNPAVGDVMRLLAVGFVINALVFVPSVELMRALAYRTLVSAQVAGAVVNSIVTIVLALAGFGYWSIAAGIIASATVSAAWLNVVARGRATLALDRNACAQYWQAGGHLFVYALLGVVILTLDNFTVGVVLGSQALGFYALAFSWAVKICELMAGVQNSVLFPTFSKIQTDPARFRSALLSSLVVVGFLSCGGYATLAVVSGDLLVHLLGGGTDKWLPALATLQLLCIYGAIRAPLDLMASAVMALGGNATLVRANLVTGVVMGVGLVPAMLWIGIEGVALVVTLAYAGQYMVYLPVLMGRLNLGGRAVAKVLIPPALAAALVFVAMRWPTMDALFGTGVVRLWAGGLAAGFAYLAIYGVVSRGAAFRELLDALRSRRTRVA